MAIRIVYFADRIKKIIMPKSLNRIKGENYFKNILLIKIVGLGDTVLMLPDIRKLKETYPEAKISVLVTPISAGILKDQSLLDEIIIYDIFGKHKGILGFMKIIMQLNRKNYDLVIDFEQHIKLITILSWFTGAGKIIGFARDRSDRGYLLTDRVLLDGNKHMVISYNELLAPLGIRFQIESLEEIEVSGGDISYIDKWLQNQKVNTNNLLVGIHIGSGESAVSRRWPNDRFAELGDRLINELNAKVIFTGSNSELSLIKESVQLMETTPIISAGSTSLKQLIALISHFSLFISNDTGPMHIGPAMGVPTIGLFGPNTPLRYSPFGSRNISVYKKVECSPCINIHRGEVPDCRQAVCMNAITVDDVWSAVKVLVTEVKTTYTQKM